MFNFFQLSKFIRREPQGRWYMKAFWTVYDGAHVVLSEQVSISYHSTGQKFSIQVNVLDQPRLAPLLGFCHDLLVLRSSLPPAGKI